MGTLNAPAGTQACRVHRACGVIYPYTADQPVKKLNVPNEAVKLLKTQTRYFQTGSKAVNLLKMLVLTC
jgi:hypothetical protein